MGFYTTSKLSLGDGGRAQMFHKTGAAVSKLHKLPSCCSQHDQLQQRHAMFYTKPFLILTVVAVAVAAAGNDDGVREQFVTDQTQQLSGNLLVIVLGHWLRTRRLDKRRLLFFALLVRIPVHIHNTIQ